MVLITGGTLDTAPSIKNTRCDDVFKGPKVVTEVRAFVVL